jgi:general stress protein YciG
MKTQKPRGFAALSPERLREIASMGGKAVPKKKRTFSASSEAAAKAGRTGGSAVPPEKRAFSVDPLLAQEAGRKGGLGRKNNRTGKADKGSNN